MAFNLVLPQMFPRTKLFAALFTRVLQATCALFLRSPTIYYVIAHEPLCDSNQTSLVACMFYIEIVIVAIKIAIRGLEEDHLPSFFQHGQICSAR